jgi:16S rRNA (guanine527-N7)-methyltransferase
MHDSTEQELGKGLQMLGLPYTAGQLASLVQYLKLLEKWNRSYNLVAASDSSSMVSRHLLDSLAIQPFLAGSSIVDMGSGAGLPGIPLAILNPHKEFVLVDSNGKKTRFLFQVKTTLKMDNISVENCRIEHYQSHRQIDMVMCRAFSSLADVVAKSQHLLSSGDKRCKLLALKGRYPEQELALLPADFVASSIKKLQIPGSDSQRHLVEIVRR